MTDSKTPVTLGVRFFLPFFLADLVMLAAAWLVFSQAQRPMVLYEIAGFAACVVIAAFLAVWPFILRQKTELKLLETDELTRTIAQIQQIDQVASNIAAATSQWQMVQEHATRTTTAARETAERMLTEQKGFQQFLEEANDTERQHLRLEVAKLRRAEGDWLQVLVRVLDHVYALYTAGQRAGQSQLTEQLAAFQFACRDAARRVGLAPIAPNPGTPFDPEAHQLPDPNAPIPEGAQITEVLATGYLYQGQLIRRALVSLAPLAPTETVSTLPSGNFTTSPFAPHAAARSPAEPLPDSPSPPPSAPESF